jgi:hypothetical protein
MKSEVALGGDTFVKDRHFHMGSVILYLDNNYILVGEDFTQKYGQKMEIFVYIPAEEKWVRTFSRDKYTETMWRLHNKHTRHKRSKVNYEQLMSHDRVHKGGGGGSRIGNNQTVTDYECTKNNLHDFHRCMYVQWN